MRPKYVCIEVTSRCNMECPICVMQHMCREKKDMELSLFRKVVSQLEQFNMPLSWLHFYGESLLNKQFPEMLDILRDSSLQGYAVGVNGTLLTEQMCEILSRHQLIVRVAVDSHDSRQYMNLRGSDQHAKIVQNTKNFISIAQGKPVKIEIQGMMTGKNDKQTKTRIVKMFGKHPNVEYIWKRLNAHKETDKSLGVFPEVSQNFRCTQPQQTFIITATGVCVACCLDYDAVQPIGDINEETLLDIWNGQKRKDIMDKIRSRDWGSLPACCDCMNIYF